MSRRGRKKEDWGGDDSDDDTGAPALGAGGLSSSLLNRGQTKAALAGAARKGQSVEKGASSDDEEDSGVDSGAEGEEGAADATTNARERSKPKDAPKGRDHEMIGTSRMKQQGISMEEEDDEDDVDHAGGDRGGQEGKHSEDVTMGDGNEPALTEEQIRRAKMKALFDRKSDDKYMTFDAEDPLKPNPNKKRAAEREDEELDEDGAKDPWLLQAAQDSERAAATAVDPALHFSSRHGLSKTPQQPSSAAFDQNESAPIFDQSRARLVLLKHMRPGETVLRAVKRLGQSTSAAAGGASKAGSGAAAPAKTATKMKNVRSKPKDDGAAAAANAAPAASPVDAAAEQARKAAFEELTEAAQGFLNSAYVEIYQDTYEKIQKLVETQRAHEARAEAHRAATAGGAGAASASAGSDARARAAARLQRKRDARAAGLPEPDSDSSDDEDAGAGRAAASSSAGGSAGASASPAESSSGVQWLHRWSVDDNEVQGPSTSEKMAEWRAKGLLDADVLLQRVLPAQAGEDATSLQQRQAAQPWIKVTQVDFAQPHITKPLAATGGAANGAAAGPAKKKFKF